MAMGSILIPKGGVVGGGGVIVNVNVGDTVGSISISSNNGYIIFPFCLYAPTEKFSTK